MAYKAADGVSKKLIQIDVSSDTVCPWCFVGKKNLEKAMSLAKEQFNFEVRWHPFFLNPHAPKEGVKKSEFYKNKFGATQYEGIFSRMKEVFRGLGFEYDTAGLTGNTMDSHRLIAFAAGQGYDKQNALVEELFQNYFTQGKYIGDKEVLLDAANKIGIKGAPELIFFSFGVQALISRYLQRRRTLALFSRLGAFPVFVVDGDPSPLKDQARMERFLRGSGIDLAVLAKTPDSGSGMAAQVAMKRNGVFSKWVQECVELLEILGMPVLKAQSEAEALCAQLNNEGHVDACITSDSDALLYGAKCVIKCLRSNSEKPYECYYSSDIEAGLDLKRKQMIAIALLVGNDHDLQGVKGFGTETALRFVKFFSEDEVLDRLSEVGKGYIPEFQGDVGSSIDHNAFNLCEGVETARPPHCSNCGHPGSRSAHVKIACDYCISCGSENCITKSTGFKCNCSDCIKECIIKEQRKRGNWQIKACKKIASEQNFPNKDIIDMFLNVNYQGSCGLSLRWHKPEVETLVDFLSFHQHWKPSYIRQQIFPVLSTIFLRELASTSEEGLLLYDQYKFHSIARVKIRHGHPCYLVKWKKAIHSLHNVTHNISDKELESEPTESFMTEDPMDTVDDLDIPTVIADDGSCFLTTEENMELVQAAFPKAVDDFLEEQRLKEIKSNQRKSNKPKSDSELPKSSRVQQSITEFYRSAKPVAQVVPMEDKQKCLQVDEPNKCSKRPADFDKKIPKSVRRRLLFD